MCGLLYRDISLAVFDHDVDVREDTTPKPLFVRNSIFRIANREGLEAVLDRVAAKLPGTSGSNPPGPAMHDSTEESVTAALRSTSARPKPRQPPRKPVTRKVGIAKEPLHPPVEAVDQIA